MIALAAFNAVMLVGFICIGYQVWFNSDSATKNVLAQLMRDSGSLFPPTFYYGRDLWVVQGHLVVWLVAPIVGNTYAAHAVSGLVLAALLLWTTWQITRRMGVSPATSLFVVLLMSAGFSYDWAEHMYGQQSYGWICLLASWVLLSGMRFFLDQSPTARHTASFAIALLVVGLLGTRGLVTLAAPLIVASLATVTWSATYIRRLGAVIGALAAGWGLYRVLVHGITLTPLHETMRAYTGITSLIDWPAVAGVFGLLPERGVLLTAQSGAVHAARFVLFLMLVGCSVVAARSFRTLTPAARFIAAFHFTLTFGLFYSLFAMQEAAGIPRYLIPAVFTGILSAGIAVDRLRSAARILGACILIVLSWTTYVSPALEAARGRGWQSLALISPLVRELERRDVHDAYATFWNSAVATVMSGSRVRVRQIEFSGGMPLPLRYLAAKEWYTEATSSGKTALIVDERTERSAFDEPRLTAAVGAPQDVFEVPPYRVLVFATNVFPALRSWQRQNFEAGASRTILFSAVDLDAQPGVRQIVGHTAFAFSTPGFLAFGPYLHLRAGRYEISFDIDAASEPSTGEAPGYWDVALGNGERILVTGQLTTTGRQWRSTTIMLGDDGPATPLETRVYFSGQGYLALYGVRLTNLDAAQ